MHSPTFRCDEDALEIGARAFCSIIERRLRS